jgi:hypothetical protein
MPKDTIYTKAFGKATTSLNKSFELALDRAGRVPLGHQIIDARTLAKQQAFPDVAGMQAVIAMDAKAIRPKPFVEGNHPKVKDIGQSPKVAAAGKVVDPTAIESAQGADNVSMDTPGGPGTTGNNDLEAG